MIRENRLMRSEGRQPELLGNQSHRGTEGLVLHPSCCVCVRVCVCRSTGLPEGGAALQSMGECCWTLCMCLECEQDTHTHTQAAHSRAVRMSADEGDPSS